METAHQPEGELPVPDLDYSLDVNALNFCRFSLLPSPKAEHEALLAVPNLVESSLVIVIYPTYYIAGLMFI